MLGQQWLLAQDARQKVERAMSSEVAPSAQQLAAFGELRAARHDSMPRNMSIAGSTAEIDVSGVLVQEESFWLWLFGVDQTTYSDIVESLRIAESDSEVTDIVMNIDSPGGEVNGLFETIEAIEAVSKPIQVRSGLAASAAYAIASVAGPIEARNAASSFGSIGVVVTYKVRDDEVEITSTEAPDKRPDPTTESGQSKIREYLDAVHGLFVDAIATGRGVTAEKVNKTFGRGAMFVAGEAKARGMIDSLRTAGSRPVATQATVTRAAAPAREKKAMTLEELRAQHPHLVAQLLAEGREDGVTAERRRCSDHLMLGAAAGIPDRAAKAISDGDSVADMQATYLAAGMNRASVQAADDESDQVAAVAAGTTEPETDLEEVVHDRVIAALKGGVHA